MYLAKKVLGATEMPLDQIFNKGRTVIGISADIAIGGTADQAQISISFSNRNIEREFQKLKQIE
jgi:hypothetical protein